MQHIKRLLKHFHLWPVKNDMQLCVILLLCSLIFFTFGMIFPLLSKMLLTLQLSDESVLKGVLTHYSEYGFYGAIALASLPVAFFAGKLFSKYMMWLVDYAFVDKVLPDVLVHPISSDPKPQVSDAISDENTGTAQVDNVIEK